MNTPTLETERLVLRKFTEDDIPALFAICSDREVNTFLPWYPLQSMEEARAFFEQRYAAEYARPKGYRYAVCQKSDNVPIGYVHVSMDDNHDLGYGLRREFWRRGMISEAAKAAVEQVKRDGLPYITATHDVNNPRNISVIFRMYQLNFDGNDGRVYTKYWDMYENHFIETI